MGGDHNRGYITGTSTRKFDDLVKALGCDRSVSKSTVSQICTQIDADVTVSRTERHQAGSTVARWTRGFDHSIFDGMEFLFGRFELLLNLDSRRLPR